MYQVAEMMYSSGRCQFLVEDFERDIELILLSVCLPVTFTISESFLKYKINFRLFLIL